MHPTALSFMPACAAVAAALLLATPQSVSAAPWRAYVTVAAGDEVMVRTQGRALRPSGSRGEVDLPVRVRFGTPVASPVGQVVMADATVRVICQGRSVTAKGVKVRTADGKPFASKDRPAAVKAARASIDRALAAPAFIDKVCQGAKA